MANTDNDIEFLETMKQRLMLSKSLGDRPEFVIWNHVLSHGNCKAWISGSLPNYNGAIIQANDVLAEPSGFGSDAFSLWKLLGSVKGWNSVLVDQPCASALGRLITRKTGARTRYLSDVNYQLLVRAKPFSDPAVRRLSIKDIGMLESASAYFGAGFWGNWQDLLNHGIIAGAVVHDRIVSTAIVSSVTQRYADIGVFTLPDFRNRGFATAAASLVAEVVEQSGKTPVWSTGRNNAASRKLAKKLGFIEVLRRTYVILENASAFEDAQDSPED